MILKNSSLSYFACSASRFSLSMNYCCLASSKSCSTFYLCSISFFSFVLANLSLSSKALLALRASISDCLSWAFSCISLNLYTSLSFSSLILFCSEICSSSRIVLCLLYSTIFYSMSFSSCFLFSLTVTCFLLASSTSPIITWALSLLSSACLISSFLSYSAYFYIWSASFSLSSCSLILSISRSFIWSMITREPCFYACFFCTSRSSCILRLLSLSISIIKSSLFYSLIHSSSSFFCSSFY